jgi:hypothetical protein
MNSTDSPTPKSAAELRICAARAQKLAISAMDALTISRLEQLARDYEAEALSVDGNGIGHREHVTARPSR